MLCSPQLLSEVNQSEPDFRNCGSRALLLISLVLIPEGSYNITMTEVLQANIFFLITAMAVVVFTIFLCVAMYFVIKILSSVRNITERIDESSEVIADDIQQLRTYIVEGSLISQIIGLFIKSKRSRRKQTEDVD